METIAVIDDGAPRADDWVFVIGSTCSGTCPAAKVLSAHPNSLCLIEAGLFSIFQSMTQPVSKEGFCARNAVGGARSGRNQSLPPEQLRQYYWCASELRHVFEGYRQAIAPNVILFGDKKAEYRRWLSLLTTTFPGCKLVLPRRDIWGQTARLFLRPWWQRRYDTKEEAARAALRLCVRVRGDDDIIVQRWQPFVVHFHDMAYSPRETIADLIDYAGIPSKNYDWSIVEEMRHSSDISIWSEVPEVLALKKEEENHGRYHETY